MTRQDFLNLSMKGLVLAILPWVGSKAQARDPDGRYAGDPERKEWFDGLSSGKGPCCADFDGHPPEAVWDTGEKDGRHNYRVMLKGEWWDVPDEAVIKEPNRYGDAVVWFYWMNEGRADQKPFFRCFLPGTLS